MHSMVAAIASVVNVDRHHCRALVFIGGLWTVEFGSVPEPCHLHLISYGATIRIVWGAWSFLEINIFVGKMGKINKWPQGIVEIQPILRRKM